jgi:3-methyladenine DNA glycosylase AlkD
MAELKSKGTDQYRRTYARHGYPAERTLGVSVADLKLVHKGIRKQQELAYQLYNTGILEPMYLAGMVADGAQMSSELLNDWANRTEDMEMIAEYTVPWVTVDHPDGRLLALSWMESEREHVASAGWCSYSGLLATKPDERLDLQEVQTLLAKAVQTTRDPRDRVRYTANGFVVAVGTYIKPLHEEAKAAAHEIGVITVDMGDTACKVPLATAAIAKVEAANKVGVKKKTIRC